MQVRGRVERWREGPINRFLLCSVLAKQARRLGGMIPEMRVAELIAVAWRNCADHKIEIAIDRNTPDVIRNQAAQMFLRAEFCTNHLGGWLPSGSQTGNGVSIVRWQAGESRTEEGASPARIGAGVHVSMGARVDSPDSCGGLSSLDE